MNDHDTLEQTLHDELSRQTRSLPQQPFDLEDVQQRAGSIRRARTVRRSGLLVAAVLAIGIPVGLSIDAEPEAIGPADTIVEAPDPETPDEITPTTGTAVAIGDTIVTDDGAEITLPVDTSKGFQFARLGDDWIVGAHEPTGYQLVVVDDGGTVQQRHDAADGGFLANDEGTAVAFRAGRSIQVLRAGEDAPITLTTELPEPLRAVTLRVLRGDCQAYDCTVVFDSFQGGDAPEVLVVDGESVPRPFLGGTLLDVGDLSPDGRLAAGHTSVDNFDQRSCSAVVVVASGERLWETCEVGDLRFSPDGSLVLASDPYKDGPNHSQWTVLSTQDGSVVGGFEGIVFDERWSTDSTVVAIVGLSGEAAAEAVEFSVDGRDSEPTGASTDDIFGPRQLRLETR